MKKTVYQIVTDKIIKQLEQGVIPWRKPWSSRGTAVNWQTQKPYRGINAFMLDPGEYATFLQISEAGGKVKKGEKGHLVVFWKWIKTEDQETGEENLTPFLRYYTVFEINSQCEGLKSRRQTETFEHDPIEAAEEIVKGYKEGPPIKFAPGRACYRPSADFISVPPLTDYKVPEEYYSTLFHEMGHSTGHQTRLNRAGINDMICYGDEKYSKEELVAEMAAAMLCGQAGIDNVTIDNSASYIGGWLRKLKDDKTLVVQAAAQAQKAADFIQGVKAAEETGELRKTA